MTRVPVRVISRGFVPNGVAAWVPLKRTIVFARPEFMTPRLMAHELQHVLQAQHAIWPLAYVLQWIATGFSYTNMPYEREARAAETNAAMLAWAREVLEAHESG